MQKYGLVSRENNGRLEQLLASNSVWTVIV